MANVKLNLGGVSVIVDASNVKAQKKYSDNFGADVERDENGKVKLLSDEEVDALVNAKEKSEDGTEAIEAIFASKAVKTRKK